MLSFKVCGDRVGFFCGDNVIGFIEVRTFKLVNINRVATKAGTLRDFGTLADRETIIRIARDYLAENGLI